MMEGGENGVLVTNGHSTNGLEHTNGHCHMRNADSAETSSDPDATGGSVEGSEDGSGPLPRGKCKWFNVLKGFGFIIPDDGSQEIFVHQSVLKMPGFRSLEEGAGVEYKCKETKRGWEATYVGGVEGVDCQGSSVRPLGKRKSKKIRCFNCGQYGNHIASKCKLDHLPKSCYECRGEDHLVSQCPLRLQQASSSSSSEKIESCSDGDTTSSSPNV